MPLLLPAGTACPQCAVVHMKPMDLRVIEGVERAHVTYLDSPQTIAEQARVQQKLAGRGGGGKASPLKVGDDFNAMARKMLPFQNIEVIEEASPTKDDEPAAAPPSVVADAAEAPAAAAARGGAR